VSLGVDFLDDGSGSVGGDGGWVGRSLEDLRDDGLA